MDNCLVCNEPIINLLNIQKSCPLYKNRNLIYYNIDNSNSISFNYCIKCFHCQINKLVEDNYDILNLNKFILGQIDTFDFPISENENILCITEGFSKIPNIDQLPIHNFLSLQNCIDKYDTILFYKSFDKTTRIKSILQLSKKLLNKNGQIIIVTSTENVVRDKKFNCLGNNMVSFFSTNSMKTLLEQFDLNIYKINKQENHSIYYIKEKTNEIGASNDVIRYLYTDIEENIYDDKLYILFNLHSLLYRLDLQKKLIKSNLNRFNNNNCQLIIGYGLNEYSINLINFCELTNEHIDYFVSFDLDNNIVVPGSNINIRNYWELLKNNQEQFDVLIVNFTSERLNDRTFEFFKNLFQGKIETIEIKI